MTQITTRNISAWLAASSVFTAALVMSPYRAQAQTYVLSDSQFGSLNVTGSLGLLKGEAQEYVYRANGERLSELKWRIPNTPIFKLGLSWEDVDSHTSFDLRGWTKLSSHHAQMDDYDWLSGTDQWSEHSVHPDTTLHDAYEVEAAANLWFWNGSAGRLGVAFGYQMSRLGWSAYGGEYSYDNGRQVGRIADGQHAIAYRQQYDVPWVGIAGQLRSGKFQLNALLKASNAARGKDTDDHYARNLRFRDETEDGRYYGASVSAGYALTDHWSLYSEAEWDRFEETKGHSTITNTVTGAKYSTGNGSVGMGRQSYSLSIGTQLRF